jgi:hypothetical protein
MPGIDYQPPTDAADPAVIEAAVESYLDLNPPGVPDHNDTTLRDAADAHPAASITGLGDAATKNTGTTAGTVAAGDDSRLSDARTPTAHNHAAGDVNSGTFDAARIPNLDASKITTGTVAAARLGSGTPSAANFLRGDGSWQAAGGGTVDVVSNVAQNRILGRVASGSGDSEELTAAQARSLLGVPPQHQIAFVANGWYSTRGHAGTSGLFTMGATMRGSLAPLYLQAGDYDRLALQQTVVGTSVYRVALYPSNATTGLPDGESPLVDGGDIDMSATTGLRELTISTTVPSDGWYWAAVKTESRTSEPTVRTFYNLSGVSALDMPLGSQTSAAVDSSAGAYFFARRIIAGWTSGAFGACPTTQIADGAVKVLVRKSA